MFLQRNKTAYTCINTFKTEKQEENMKKVAEVFKEKTGKDYQTAVVWKMTTKIMTCIIWTPIATMWSSVKNRW